MATQAESRARIIAAVITGGLGLIGTIIGVRALSGRGSAGDRFHGVVMSRDGSRIAGARVSVETGAAVPINGSSDSEGVFNVILPKGTESMHVRIEADGYQRYDQQGDRRFIDTAEYRLDPLPKARGPQPDTELRRSTPAPATKASMLSSISAPMPAPSGGLLDESLPLRSGPNAPWAVVVFGNHMERRSDVMSWVRDALQGSGRDTISLFRKTSDEQREASRLFEGNAALFQQLNAGTRCSNILVGKLVVASHPPMDGLFIAEARLSVHVLSPSGEMLKQFQLEEKGGGENDENAIRNAVNNLQEVIQRELPGSIG
ncbi:MAG: hypothetical protein JOZ54_13320 [Acidobacteria bacterium]|nr:hypothetical protein [Acidobacteriota bacterium]